MTPLGIGVETLWKRLCEGHSGVGPITLFDASRFPVRIAAEVPNWSRHPLAQQISDWPGFHRHAQFALAAGIQAGEMADLPAPTMDPLRSGVYLGCGEAFPEVPELARWLGASAELPDPAFKPDLFYEPSATSARLAGWFNAQGGALNCITACASSSQAIGEAAEVIRRNEADVMLAGGAHSMIHPLGVAGFHRLSTLSAHSGDPSSAMRPFDADRDGFVIGEGGAVLVLEELEHARRRGVEIYGELSGYGVAQDAHRITDPHPDGRGATDSLRRALAAARIPGDAVDYVNAHGTSTVANDVTETVAIKQAFGRHAYRVPISSTKSMLGHFTTAAGAIECLIGVLVLRSGVIPPTINHAHPDPKCDLDYVPNAARERRCRHVVSNSFGFGGQNVAVVLSRFDELAPHRAAFATTLN